MGLFYLYNRQKKMENHLPYYRSDNIIMYDVHTQEQPAK